MAEELKTIETVDTSPFKHLVMTLGELPTSFVESMTYYECLAWLVNFIQNTVIPTVNNNAEAVEELQTAFTTLKNFVDTYFDNLDVQDEVDHKLDEMAQDGTLENIIKSYIDTSVVFTFNTLAILREQDLAVGIVVKTLGYDSIGDNGDAYYKIRTAAGDVDNGGNIIVLNNGNVAELIVLDRSVTTKQFGCKGDGTTNDTTQFQTLLNFVKNNYGNGCVIKIVGKCLVNPTLQLKGTSSNRLSNITFTSIDGGTSAYSSADSLSNGILVVHDYTTSRNHGLDLDYINGAVIKNIFFKSTETVENGDIPLNKLSGVHISNCNSTRIEYCNFNGFYTGFHTSGSGLLYMERNNFSLCNVGCWLQENGDSTLIGNYFNTNGWNIRNDDGSVKTKYSSLGYSVYGMGLWCGTIGNTNIIGGKCEWNDSGFYFEQTQGVTITGVNFDYNVRTHIGVQSNTTVPNNTAMSIVNNRFASGGWCTSGGYLAGASVCLWKVYGITITGNTFVAGEKAYDNMFDGTSTYYGPKLGYIRCVNAYNTCIADNMFTINKQSVVGSNSNIIFGNNMDSNTYAYTNSVVLKSNRQMILCQDNWVNLASGDFEAGDLIRKKTDLTNGWKCTASGSYGSVSGLTASVINADITVGNVTIPGDATIIELGGTLTSVVHPGLYINIGGVTGTKRIMDIVHFKNPARVFCKLDSACDVAVNSANVSVQNPTFTEI